MRLEAAVCYTGLINQTHNLTAAKERLDWAVEYGVPMRFTGIYEEANSAYAQALNARSQNNFDQARESALRVISILAVAEQTPPLPAKYLVKSWNTTRDCLWNIAAKPEIYGNPFRWGVIFNANRDKITDPNVIEPGMILDIPSIAGEFRYGIMEEY